jgi:hypothetical protein
VFRTLYKSDSNTTKTMPGGFPQPDGQFQIQPSVAAFASIGAVSGSKAKAEPARRQETVAKSTHDGTGRMRSNANPAVRLIHVLLKINGRPLDADVEI